MKMLTVPCLLISASVSWPNASGGITSDDSTATSITTRTTGVSRVIIASLARDSPGASGVHGESSGDGASSRSARRWLGARRPLRRSRAHRVTLAVAGVLDDPSQELDDDLGAELRGIVGGDVEHRVYLHEVEADHLSAARDSEQRLPQLVVGQPVDLGRRAPRHERKVEHVDVDRDVDRLVRGQEIDDGAGTPATELRHRDDVVAAGARVLDVALPRAQAPDADLDDVMARLQAGDVADRVTVGPLHAVDERAVVHVGVE